MTPSDPDRVERLLLLHLLEHHSQQVRFEASPWVTEFGILRRFAEENPGALRRALKALEMSRMVYRRTQYVVGYSEPKHVYSLTPSGHRKALEVREVVGATPPPRPTEHRVEPPAERGPPPPPGGREAPGDLPSRGPTP